MKLLRLTADNFMRLVAVEITPDGSLVQITGANGAGKSSVLRALECALAGKGALPADPVRHGADRAEISVDLGKYLITRTIKPDGSTTLVVSSPDGARFPSPQKLLDDLLGSLSFDPLAFTRMTPAQQREQLAAMVGLSQMLAELAAADRVDFENRTAINRDLKRAKVQLEAMPDVAPCEPVDVSAVLAQLRDARAHNDAAHRELSWRAEQTREMGRERSQAEAHRVEAARLLDLADVCDARADAIDNQLSSSNATPLVDTAPLEQCLDDAQALNAQARAYQQRTEAATAVSALALESEALTATMAAREAERAAVIAAAPFPIEGLALTADGVTYRGVPFEQASSAEQLRVSAAIGMALNATLRVMLVRDGSLLDPQSMQLLADLAEAQDYLVLCETVDTSGRVGIYIEDGQVAAINGAPVEAIAA